MIFMTFSFLWWLSIVKAPNVNNNNNNKKQNKTKQANKNKGKGKEERNKIHCNGKRMQQNEFLSKVTVNE